MTKTFCDKCGEETTGKENYRFWSDSLSYGSFGGPNFVLSAMFCKSCTKDLDEQMKKIMGSK